jgi:hypothetical protein
MPITPLKQKEQRILSSSVSIKFLKLCLAQGMEYLQALDAPHEKIFHQGTIS